MAKKNQANRSGVKSRLLVVGTDGTRQRFLRGMVTHDLVQRGLSFDDAFAAARTVRDQLADRDEVSTVELNDLIQAHLEAVFGDALPGMFSAPAGLGDSELPRVTSQGREQPFSRGLLARSIVAAGLDIDRAYRLVSELETTLRAEDAQSCTSDEVVRRVAELMERSEGKKVARRYRLVRRLHKLPRPLVIYLGGASGTGKSTLALELAPPLRIYRVNATDTIRQVMRMVFSKQMLPALHTSSFEVAAPYEQADDGDGDGAESRIIASFEEQATRVAVGVRAMVERTIAENVSMLIEGVHLYPPLVPFLDLEGMVYQVPIVLATRDRETHRSRFLSRARVGRRHAERYLERFHAIRAVHDHLLQQAENHDVPLIGTNTEEPPVAPALRLITSLIQRQVPSLSKETAENEQPVVPALLLIIDGLADRPVRALGNRTPLEAADTPTLDRLAREGRLGLADPVAPGVVPDTAAGSLALFGQSPLAMKRGPVEALGTGMVLSPGDIALRGNLATLDAEGRVTDRRAGRIREQAEALARALDRLPLPGNVGDAEVRVKAGTEHRLAIVLRGEGLSSAIHGSDPGDGAPLGPPITPRPIDPENPRAVYTAGLLALFEQEARRVLAEHPINRERRADDLSPATAVLTRGPGRLHRLTPLEESGVPLRLACVAGDRTLLGLARWLGADTISTPTMTANLDTDLRAKMRLAAKALERNELVVVHVKGADIAAHDQRPDLKASFIEAVDQELAWVLDQLPTPVRIAVAADHATLSESGQHAADPLPVLIWGEGFEPDEVDRFDEQAAAAGSLQRFPLQMLLSRLFSLS